MSEPGLLLALVIALASEVTSVATYTAGASRSSSRSRLGRKVGLPAGRGAGLPPRLCLPKPNRNAAVCRQESRMVQPQCKRTADRRRCDSTVPVARLQAKTLFLSRFGSDRSSGRSLPPLSPVLGSEGARLTAQERLSGCPARPLTPNPSPLYSGERGERHPPRFGEEVAERHISRLGP